MRAPLPGCSKGCGMVFATVEEARNHEKTCTWVDDAPTDDGDAAAPDTTTDDGGAM